MTDLLTQPATHLLALLRTRKISALELADLHIARIEHLNPQLNALVDFDPDRVRRQARAADNHPGERPSLHGLPLTIKASIAVAHHRCETGSRLNRNHRPTQDAATVQRLRAAGALILGTTNCPEFLMAYETDNRLYGPTNNPWDLSRTAGGSSGGESAAIAAGLSAAGLGSDGGGSVRTPAHFTGICALKPTPGRVPAAGHLPPPTGPFSLLGAIGPMARTIADVDLLFRTISGPLDTDPLAAPVPYRAIPASSLLQTPIGVLEDDLQPHLGPATPETRAAVRAAADALRLQGFRVEPVPASLLAALESARALWYTLFVRCGAMLLEPTTRGHEPSLSPTFLDFLNIAHADPPLTAPELLAAWVQIDPIRTHLLEEMRAFPILLTPVCAVPAFPHGERQWTVEGRPLAYLDAMRYTQWFNLLGAPAAVVPIATVPITAVSGPTGPISAGSTAAPTTASPITQSQRSLPIAVQIAGRPYADELVLAIAHALETAPNRNFGYHPPPEAPTSSARK